MEALVVLLALYCSTEFGQKCTKIVKDSLELQEDKSTRCTKVYLQTLASLSRNQKPPLSGHPFEKCNFTAGHVGSGSSMPSYIRCHRKGWERTLAHNCRCPKQCHSTGSPAKAMTAPAFCSLISSRSSSPATQSTSVKVD